MSFDTDIQKFSRHLNTFLDKAAAQEVRNSGGRKFKIEIYGGTHIVSLKQIIKAAQCIAKTTKPADAHKFKHTLERIRELDKDGKKKLKEASLLGKILTALRSFFGNIGFSKEKALTQLEKFCKKESSLSKEQLRPETSEEEGSGSESTENTDKEGPQRGESFSSESELESEDEEEDTRDSKQSQISSSTSSVAPERIVLSRKNETKIDVKLNTTILKDDMPVDVELYQVGDELTFRLYDADRFIGMIDLVKRKTHIEINAYGIPSGNYANVGDALREIAVRQSFKEGFDGQTKVYLHESRDNVSYFKFGFRYEQPLERVLGTLSRDSFPLFFPLFNDYFRAVKEKRDAAPSLDQITRCESRSMLAALDALKEEAEIELRRPPNNLKETIDNGFYINWNTILERVYIYPEEKRNGPRYNDVEEHTRGGWMYLSNNAIEHWRDIIDG